MLLLTLLTGAALLLAGLLGYEQVLVQHGAQPGGWCLAVEGCAAAMRAPAMSLSGVPVPVWAMPLLAVVAVLLPGARGSGPRAAQASGGILTIVGLLVSLAGLAVVFTPGLLACPPQLALLLLLLALLVQSVRVGARRPSVPHVDDWLPAMLVGLTMLMGTGFAARILDFRLTQEEEQARTEPSLTLPAGTALVMERVSAGRVTVPPVRSPAPIDDQDPFIGKRDATVTAVVFLDLLDQPSRELAWVLSALEPRFEDRVRFVTKHLPMDASCNEKRRRTQNPRSCEVAVALQCAYAQRGFRGMRQAILRNPDRVEEVDLLQLSARLGLDQDEFRSCLSSKEALEAVEADVVQAGKGGLIDPPWLFVEGRVLSAGASEAEVEALLAVALGEREPGEDGQVEAFIERPVAEAVVAGPLNMVEVPSQPSLWIDAVEASFAADGRALARSGVAPWPVDLDQARSACSAAGKRLCTRAEWLSACQGAAPIDEDGDGDAFNDLHEGRLWPYGDGASDGWCASDLPIGRTASRAACRSPEGAYDLAGNMAEWVEEGLLLGGNAEGPAAGCQAVQTVPGPGWRSEATGFRCCAGSALDGGAAEATAQAPPALPAPVLPESLRVEPRAGSDPQPVLVVAWSTECAACQVGLRVADRLVAEGASLRVLALSVQSDSDEARKWLELAGLKVEARADPDARLAGQLGVDGLPWMGLYDAQGAWLVGWSEPPTIEELREALSASPGG